MVQAPPEFIEDVRRYTHTVNHRAVSGLVRYLSLALRRPGAATVTSSDPRELVRLREGYLKNRLRLDLPDAELDAAVHDVMTLMAGDPHKSRVTVCYLLAARFGRLPLFV